MSKRLSSIKTSCPLFDKAISYIDNIVPKLKQYQEDGLVVDDWLIKEIKDDIDYEKSNIEEARSINGDLRDTCLDIADTKNEEIEELHKRMEDIEKDYEKRIDELGVKIRELELLANEPTSQ